MQTAVILFFCGKKALTLKIDNRIICAAVRGERSEKHESNLLKVLKKVER